MQDPCARVSVSTFMVQAPFLMSSVRSLDTLWSRVCVQRWWWGSECPREEVQRSAKPFGRIVEGYGQEELLRGQRKETDGKEVSKKTEIKSQGQHSQNQKASGEHTCIYNQASSPQRKSSLYKLKLKRAS